MLLQVTRNTLMVFEEVIDICGQKKKFDMIELYLAGFAIPKKCPITASYTSCRNNENVLTFSESSRRLLSTFSMVARDAFVKVILTHDTGKSCFEVESEINKLKIS